MSFNTVVHSKVFNFSKPLRDYTADAKKETRQEFKKSFLILGSIVVPWIVLELLGFQNGVVSAILGFLTIVSSMHLVSVFINSEGTNKRYENNYSAEITDILDDSKNAVIEWSESFKFYTSENRYNNTSDNTLFDSYGYGFSLKNSWNAFLRTKKVSPVGHSVRVYKQVSENVFESTEMFAGITFTVLNNEQFKIDVSIPEEVFV